MLVNTHAAFTRARRLSAPIISLALALTACSGPAHGPLTDAQARDRAPEALRSFAMDSRDAVVMRIDLNRASTLRDALVHVRPIVPAALLDQLDTLHTTLTSEAWRPLISRARPMIVTMPPAHAADPALGACLEAGIMCPMDAYDGAILARAWIPTDRGDDLARALPAHLPKHHLITRSPGHVRVDLAWHTRDLSPQEVARLVTLLKARAKEAPRRDSRLTTARATLMTTTHAAAIYARSTSLAGWLLRRDMGEALPRVRALPEGERAAVMGRLLGHQRALMSRLRADALEFEDAAVLFDADAQGGLTVDLIQSRTALGQQLAGRMSEPMFLPEVAMAQPTIELDWAAALTGALKAAPDDVPGLTLTALAALDVQQITGALKTSLKAAAGDALPLPVAVRARLKLSPAVAGEAGGLPIRGGLVMLFEATSATRERVNALTQALGQDKGVQVRAMVRSDDRIEVRLAVREDIKRLFDSPQGATRVHPGRLRIRLAQARADREVGALLDQLPKHTHERLNAALQGRDVLSLERDPNRQRHAWRLYFGSERVGGPNVQELQAPAAPAATWCAPTLHALTATLRPGDPGAGERWEGADAQITTASRAAASCASAGGIKKEDAALIDAQLWWWRAAYTPRVGGAAAPYIRRACAAGSVYACAGVLDAAIWTP